LGLRTKIAVKGEEREERKEASTVTGWEKTKTRKLAVSGKRKKILQPTQGNKADLGVSSRKKESGNAEELSAGTLPLQGFSNRQEWIKKLLNKSPLRKRETVA